MTPNHAMPNTLEINNAQTTIINNSSSNERIPGEGIIIGHCKITNTTNQIIKVFLLIIVTYPHVYNSQCLYHDSIKY